MNGKMVVVMLSVILALMIGLGSCMGTYPPLQQPATIPTTNSETTPMPSPASAPVAQISGDETFLFTYTHEGSSHILPLYLSKGQILELQWRLDGEGFIYYPWYADPQGQVKWKYVEEKEGGYTYGSPGEGAPCVACREGTRQMIANADGSYTFYFAAKTMFAEKPFNLYVHYESKTKADPKLLNPPSIGGEFKLKLE